MAKIKEQARLHTRRGVAGSLVDGLDSSVPSTTFRFASLYSGGPLEIDGYDAFVYLDVASLRVDPAPKALVEHDMSAVVGRLERIEKIVDPETGRLSVFCDAIIGGNELAGRVLDWARNVAAWVPSIGAYRIDPENVVYLEPGQTREINGTTARGPCYLTFDACLCEGSFVAIGGDGDARAILASFQKALKQNAKSKSKKLNAKGKNAMSFEEFCQSKGIDPANATQEELDALREEYDAQSAAPVAAAEGCDNKDDDDKNDVQASEGDGAATEELETIVEDAVAQVVEELPADESAAVESATTEIVEEIVDELKPEFETAPVASAFKAIRLAKKKMKARLAASKEKKSPALSATARLKENRRVEAVKTLCASFGRDGARTAAEAISGGWSPARTERFLNASLGRKKMLDGMKSPGVGGGLAPNGPRRQDVLAASLAMTCGMEPRRVQAAFGFDQRVVDAALDRLNRNATLRTIIGESNNSFNPGSYRQNTPMLAAVAEMRDNCRARALTSTALGRRNGVAAGFSTISATDIFSAVLQAFLEPTPEKAPRRYTELTRETVCVDFNQVASYSATLRGRLRTFAEGGEIENLSFETEKFERATTANGAVFSIPEHLFINDQIGAFADLAIQLGDLGDDCVERDVAEAFWKVVDGDAQQNSAAMVSGTRGNYLTGSTSALDETGLGLARKALNEMKNKNGFPLGSGGELLVTGSALFAKAARLYSSETLAVADTIGTANVFRGVYKPIEWQYLDPGICRAKKNDGSTASLFAANTTAWFLLRDPSRRPCVCVNKLSGFESPQIRQFDAAPNYWGTTYQLLYPYSVSTQYPDAIVVCKGS